MEDYDKKLGKNNVRLGILQRQISNLHISERYRAKTELELLENRKETFNHFTDIGIECPLMSPMPRKSALRRRRKNNVVLNGEVPHTISQVQFLHNHSRISSSTSTQSSLDIGERVFAERDQKRPAHISMGDDSAPPDNVRTRRDILREIEHRRSKEANYAQRDADRPDIYYIDLKTYLRQLPKPILSHLMKNQYQDIDSPTRSYHIGTSSKRHNRQSAYVDQLGVRHIPKEVASNMAPRSSPLKTPFRRPIALSCPVTEGLRRNKTNTANAMWTTYKRGELPVEMVWKRRISSFDTTPLCQVLREDTVIV